MFSRRTDNSDFRGTNMTLAGAIGIVLMLYLGTLPATAAPISRLEVPAENLSIPEEMRECAENLRKIHAAIKAYEKDEGELPEWLCDLVPRYLAKEVLLCPAHPDRTRALYYPDPNLPCSYSYEFSATRMNSTSTCRDWKMQQLKQFGDVVPIVRCMDDGTNMVLSISTGGQVYWSALPWEYLFTPARPATRTAQDRPTSLLGKSAPLFTLKDLAGKEVSLADLRGNVVLLDFWATWCGPCQGAIPHLEALHQKYKDRGLIVVGMNSETDHDRVRAFAQERVSYPILLDAKEQFRDYGVRGIPAVFYIDREGLIRHLDVGFGPGKERVMEQKVKELLNGGDEATSETEEVQRTESESQERAINEQKMKECIRIQGLKADKTLYTQGEQVLLTYDIVNMNNARLDIPLNTQYSRPMRLIGVRQAWIEPMDDSAKTTDFGRAAKRGTRYAAGGSIFPVGKSCLDPGEQLHQKSSVGRELMPGRYKYYIEMKAIDDGSLMDEATVEFIVLPKPGSAESPASTTVQPEAQSAGSQPVAAKFTIPVENPKIPEWQEVGQPSVVQDPGQASPSGHGQIQAKKVLIIYGNKQNADGFAALLEDQGLECTTVPKPAAHVRFPGRYDLVITLSCCSAGYCRQTWDSALLNVLGDARVLACGDAGAALLQTRSLLVGHPNGWHGTRSPKRVLFPETVSTGPFSTVLTKPYNLLSTDDETVIEIHSGTEELEHVGIYDGGTFPKGTCGIGREEKDAHHWMICKQGNYTLWGADSRIDNLTAQGKELFVNLCSFLAEATSEPLVFPEKRYLTEGRHEGVLIGGARDEYTTVIQKPGQLRMTLEWDGDNSMMFMSHKPLTKRVDGRSPLVFVHNTSDEICGTEFRLVVHSFDLPESIECPYSIRIAYESWGDIFQ